MLDFRNLKRRSSFLMRMAVLGMCWLGAACAGQTGIPGPESAVEPLPSPTPPIPPDADLPGAIWLSPVDEMALVFVPAGPFEMGVSPADSAAGPDEFPRRTVYLDAYWMDQTEVTNGMYTLCVQEGGCEPLAIGVSLTRNDYFDNLSYGEYPVVNVNWEQAAAYCTWAGRRLPTEAEWEKAARGDDNRIYPWGDQEPSCQRLAFGNPGPGRGVCVEDTVRVGSFPDGASFYGALDMGGNVWEWVADWYSPDAYSDPDTSNPVGPATGEARVMRGGAITDSPAAVRASKRSSTHPENASYFIGFRCALPVLP
jgi:formylglycine-generating enzyme required for sulfatase activity